MISVPRWIGGAAALLVLAQCLPAQLSGLYSIDGGVPTGGTNYQTFQACATDLQTMGVSGPVLILVASSVTPYAGFSLGAIPGASPANMVVFQAAGGPGSVTISGAATGFAQAVRLGTSTSTTSTAFGTGPSYVIFDGFEVTGAASGAQILMLGTRFVTIRNCTAHTGGSGIGVTAAEDSTIEDCEVYGVTQTPGAGGSTLYSGGIWVYNYGTRAVIQRNRVHDCAANGIFVGSSSDAAAPPNCIIINNMVWNCATHTSSNYAGSISMRRAANAIVANNSISVPSTSQYAGLFLQGTSVVVRVGTCANNIVQRLGATGVCVQIESATSLPIVMDNNLYDVLAGANVGGLGAAHAAPTTTYATLAAWQAAYPAADAASIVGAPGFMSATDLHINGASPAFEAGMSVAAVTDDIDGQPRPLGSNYDIGADEALASGLFANFAASALAGPAPLSVTFTDLTFTSDPGGVLTWSWDFNNDGTPDSTSQNPLPYVYACPGTYSVSLTVTDASNPSSTLTRTNFISVGQFVFSLATSGGGVGDLTITPVPTTCGAAAGAGSGWTLASLATALPVGAGPIFGLVPDSVTFSFLYTPEAPGNLIHFTVAPGLYPNAGAVPLPAGMFSALAGLSLDGLMVYLTPSGGLAHVTNVSRVTF